MQGLGRPGSNVPLDLPAILDDRLTRSRHPNMRLPHSVFVERHTACPYPAKIWSRR